MATMWYCTVLGAILLISQQASTASISKDGERVMFCYFGSWSTYRPGIANYDVSYISPSLCSHAIYSYTGLKNGVIASLDEYNDFEENWGKGTMKKFISHTNKNGIKPILGIGGWNEGSIKYSQMASTASGRETFANSAVAFLLRYGFQGLDMDWEYPTMYGGVPEDKENLVLLLQTLSEKFRAQGLILTIGVAGFYGTADAAYNFAKIGELADFVLIMSFDYNSASSDKTTGLSAPLYSNDGEDVKTSVLWWLNGGAPASKLVVGLPLYARSFRLANPEQNGIKAPITGPGAAGQYSQEPGFLTYYEMCMNLSWNVVKDYDTWVTPYVYAYSGYEWVSYDDPTTVAAKAQFVVDSGLAGMMAFSLESEDFRGNCGQANSLLTSANKVLGRL